MYSKEDACYSFNCQIPFTQKEYKKKYKNCIEYMNDDVCPDKRSRRNALLVDPTDVAAIAEALVEVLRDAGLRADLAARGAARAARYSWERTARATLEAYHEVSNA
jgi:glycosyltransferase involved in cell wall biosynthesis